MPQCSGLSWLLRDDGIPSAEGAAELLAVTQHQFEVFSSHASDVSLQ